MSTPPHERCQRAAVPQWCATIHATLATTFTPARTLRSWADPPMVLPGFRVRAAGHGVIVRCVPPHDAALHQRRACAAAMLTEYRRVLRAHGWQVDVVAAPRALPALRCWRPDTNPSGS